MRKLLIAAVAFLCLSAASQAQEQIRVLTGGTGGVYYALGAALSKIYGEEIVGAKATVQATEGSFENLMLLQQGRGEVAFALGDAISLAWAGRSEAGLNGRLDRLRGLTALHSNYIQIVAAADSGIASLDDLKGARVSVGTQRSPAELSARAVFAAAGIEYEDFGTVEYLPFAEAAERIKNRQLDATLQSSGLGVTSIKDLAAAVDIVVVPIPPQLVEAIGDPAYLPAVIPAETYQGQSEEVQTAAVANLLVTHEAVSEAAAYQMTRLLFEHLDDLKAAHPAAAGISLRHALSPMPVPLHPGAAAFFREAGLLK